MKHRESSGFLFTLSVVGIIAALVLCCLLIFRLPDSVSLKDTSASGIYTLSDQTEELLAELDEDITIYHICTAGKEDTVVQNIIARYADRNKHIRIVWRDPVAYPDFTPRYTDKELPDNSLIVTSAGDSRVLSFMNLYVIDYEKYYSNNTVAYNYAVESEVSGAIRQLTAESARHIYFTSGHGEQSLSITMKNAIQQQGFELTEINLLTVDDLPGDCTCLLILGPAKDLSASEAEKVSAFLRGGGSLMLVSDYVQGGRQNLERLMAEEYGIRALDGVVLESDSARFMSGYPYYLMPKLIKHSITRPLINADYVVLTPISQAMEIGSAENVIAEAFLSSSDTAYRKDPYTMTTYAHEEGDPQGRFPMGVAAADSQTGAHVVWLTSVVMWEDDVVLQSAGGNQDLILNAFGWLCDYDEVITIHAKSMTEDRLILSDKAARGLSILIIGVIPGAFLTAGTVIGIRRKRKK